MPSREYYIKDTEQEYKRAYLKFMIDVAKILGADHDHATREMTEVLDLEMELANVSTVCTCWLPNN